MRRYVMMLLGLVLLLAGSFGAAQGPEIKGTVIIRKVGKYVEIEVSGGRSFPVVQAIPELQIGAQFTCLSRFSDSGGLIFFMSGEDFAKTKDGDAIHVKYSGGWNFGNLDKSKMAQGTPPSQLPAAVVAAWQKAGAEVGWAGQFQSGRPRFGGGEGKAGELPAFRFRTWKAGVTAAVLTIFLPASPRNVCAGGDTCDQMVCARFVEASDQKESAPREEKLALFRVTVHRLMGNMVKEVTVGVVVVQEAGRNKEMMAKVYVKTLPEAKKGSLVVNLGGCCILAAGPVLDNNWQVAARSLVRRGQELELTIVLADPQKGNGDKTIPVRHLVYTPLPQELPAGTYKLTTTWQILESLPDGKPAKAKPLSYSCGFTR